MLDALLKKTGSFMVKALMALLILSFAIWGIGDVLTPGARISAVVNVGSVNIQPQDFNSALQNEIARLQPLFNNSLDREQARNMGIAGSVLQGLIEKALFDLEAKELGISISDRLVREAITQNPAFRSALGEFDRNTYNIALQRAGISEKQLVADIRSNLRNAHLLDALEGADAVPAAFAEPLYRYQNERRTAVALRFADESMPDPGVPDENTLANFHRENESLFTAPEYRKVSYVSLLVSDLAKSIDVSEQRLRQAFEEQRGGLGQPERRHIEQMLLADEEAAKKAHELLVQGRAFADVAKEIAGADPQTLDLGTLTKAELSQRLPELAEPAFAAKEGGFSEPVRSPIGWHIVAVPKVEAGRDITFEEARPKLREMIARDAALDSLYRLANQVEDALGGGATLEEAAAKAGLQVRVLPAVDPSGRDPAGKPIEDMPPGNRFLETVFATAETVESPMTEAGNDGFFLLRVDSIVPPAVKSLDQIRDDVITSWKAKRRADEGKVRGDKALERVKAGEDPEAVAKSIGATLTTTEPFPRTVIQPTEGLTQALVTAVFRLKPGEATLARSPDAYHVAKLMEIIPANPAADQEGLEDLRRQLAQSLKEDLRGQFAGALQTRFPVSVNRNALDQLLQ